MKKKILAPMDKCYSIAPLTYQGKPHILVAAEKTDRCILFDAQGTEVATVWNEPGGVMTMVQVPGSDGQFLATHKFYSPNDSKEAKLPDDLSSFDENHQLPLTVLKDQMLKNHGYYKVTENGTESSLVCSDTGVYRFYPPTEKQRSWTVEQLLDTPASDATMVDLDGDGKLELVVLAPFHGNDLSIYKKTDNGFEKVFEYPEKIDFLHAIWSGSLCGKTVAIIGHRRGARRLMALYWEKDHYTFKTIDDDCGSANAYGYSYEGQDILISTNREINQIAMYLCEEGDIV